MKCDGLEGGDTEATKEAGEAEGKSLMCIIQRSFSDMRDLCHNSLELLCRDYREGIWVLKIRALL